MGIAAGGDTGLYEFSCALMGDGTVQCWGNNDVGQLGDGTTASRDCAAPVQGLADATGIASGNTTTCARTPTSTWCWGGGVLGGGGAAGPGSLPVRVQFP